MNNYDDIIDIDYVGIKYHDRMSIESRSAQFAPFKSLVGFYDEIDERGRLTSLKKEISETKKNNINMRLIILKQNIKNNPEITITYFKKDKTKNGGKYIEVIGFIKNIDNIRGKITLDNDTIISFDCILDIDCEIFLKYNI